MDRSPKEAAAVIGRGETNVSFLPNDYRLLLPALPTGDAAKLSVILHADLQGKPYRIEDFREPLDKVGVLPGVAGLGAFQMSHVWLLKLHSLEAKTKLLEAGSLQVKGRFCHLVDPSRRELRIKLHWVTFDVPVDTVRHALEPFGSVKEIIREKWKVPGFVDVESTTLVVRMTLKDGVSLENLPNQLRICGGNVLVVVPGRAPICLRCHRAGHIHRDCRVPRCNLCQAFGHEASSCVKTYARVTGNNTAVASDDAEYMDVFEAERAATATTPTDRQTQGGSSENGGVCDEAKPRPSPGASKEKAASEAVEEVAAEKVTDTPDDPAATAVPRDDDGKDRVDKDVGTNVHDEVKVKGDDDGKSKEGEGDDDGKSKEGEGGVDGRLTDAETERSGSAFFWFAKVERPNVRQESPDASVGEVAAELGRRWNNVGDDTKSKYEGLAAKDKARYEKELKDEDDDQILDDDDDAEEEEEEIEEETEEETEEEDDEDDDWC